MKLDQLIDIVMGSDLANFLHDFRSSLVYQPTTMNQNPIRMSFFGSYSFECV